MRIRRQRKRRRRRQKNKGELCLISFEILSSVMNLTLLLLSILLQLCHVISESFWLPCPLRSHQPQVASHSDLLLRCTVSTRFACPSEPFPTLYIASFLICFSVSCDLQPSTFALRGLLTELETSRFLWRTSLVLLSPKPSFFFFFFLLFFPSLPSSQSPYQIKPQDGRRRRQLQHELRCWELLFRTTSAFLRSFL